MYQWCKELQARIGDRYPESLPLNHLVACTQLSKEVMEVLDCVPWKFERKDEKLENVPRDKLLEELVDVFNFYQRLLWLHNVTPEEFEKAWEKKRIIVERRLLCQ